MNYTLFFLNSYEIYSISFSFFAFKQLFKYSIDNFNKLIPIFIFISNLGEIYCIKCNFFTFRKNDNFDLFKMIINDF